MTGARSLPRWEVADVTGAVVAIDVIRAFTTAAYAFGAGAREILLADTVAQALALRVDLPHALVMGEEHGRRPDGFDFSNSPVLIAAADLDGRTLIQRTSAGTRGVVAAIAAERLWCASLVVASATARAVAIAGLGPPTYVITGRFEDALERGVDDVLTAELIERARVGEPLDAPATARAILACDEATSTLALGGDDAHPDDIVYATRIDHFDFAMEVERTPDGLLRVTPTRP